MAGMKVSHIFAAACAGGAGAAAILTVKNNLQSDRRHDQLLLDNLPAEPKKSIGLVQPVKSVRAQNIVANPTSFKDAIRTSTVLITRLKEEMGIPGISVAVNVDGQTVWKSGFGFADLENSVPCTPATVMRIASISKSITMTSLAKLWEQGQIDLDKPVQDYVSFPQKKFDGQKVEITTRMLTNHLSGIRHWKTGEETKSDGKVVNSMRAAQKEMYLNQEFQNVTEALNVFKDDELEFKPGTKFLYSTPAWTLISAVMEKAAGKPFPKIMGSLFTELGLKNTRLDENSPIVFNRARYYMRNEQGRLTNAPSVNNSCKWAGGGFLSTVTDLVTFGDAMLYCFQQRENLDKPGYLKKSTINELWTVSPITLEDSSMFGYGMGWMVVPHSNDIGGVKSRELLIGHSGGAVGASSALIICPSENNDVQPVSGVTVAVIANLQNAGSITKTAMDIAKLFKSDTKQSLVSV